MDEKKIESLEQFSQKHPGVDVTPLLQRNLQSPPNRWRVYLISLLFPPFGLYYTIKYVFVDNDSEEKRRLGWMALWLTVGIIVLSIATFSLGVQYLKKTQPLLPENPQDLLHEYKDLVQ